ncbi:hypothetical protein [Anatilimnocola aggregata]|uniref:hypothetical protein n=1 Tax=Anatilimnocola aggregata TaxID=2528021 RepID=UPI00192E545C|nr:hypothetical protein [Anatilimnocola aggregata]
MDDDRLGGDMPLAGELAKAVIMQQSHTPTAATLDLPLGAAEILPVTHRPLISTLWRLGDDPQQALQLLAAQAKLAR